MSTTALTLSSAATPAPVRLLDTFQPDPALILQAVAIGDVSQMSPEQRLAYYVAKCREVGLSPLSRPFTAIQGDDGKVDFYANKSCAEGMRKTHNVSTRIISRERQGDVYVVVARASLPTGREAEAQGVVAVVKAAGQWKRSQQGKNYFEPLLDAEGEPIYRDLRGDALGRAMKIAETQALRRVTLSICGLSEAPDGVALLLHADGSLGQSSPRSASRQGEGEDALPAEDALFGTEASSSRSAADGAEDIPFP